MKERRLSDNFEVFVADDAFEGGAGVKCPHFDDFELIGESDTLKGGTVLE